MNFCSPFDVNISPAPFVFLVAMVSSTLTLALISNRLRDKKIEIHKQLASPESNSPELNIILQNAKCALCKINELIRLHLIITNLAVFRVVLYFFFCKLSSFGDLILYLDMILILGALYIFAYKWWSYFIKYGQ